MAVPSIINKTLKTHSVFLFLVGLSKCERKMRDEFIKDYDDDHQISSTLCLFMYVSIINIETDITSFLCSNFFD